MSGYWPSYAAEDHKEWLEAFNRDGLVVIDNVISAEELEKSQTEVWDYLGTKGTVKRDDPRTWGNDHWPKDICKNGGFMGRFPYMRRLYTLDQTLMNKQPQAWKNRENPVIYDVYRRILGDEKLWVSLDRYGIMRPTKCTDEGKDWLTKKDWLHWDLSPFHFGTSAAGFAPDLDYPREKIAADYGMRRLQGLLTLTDCPESVGGFHCVKGFHGDRFYKWRAENYDSYGSLPEIATRNFVEVPDEDPMRKEIVRVPMRAGSLLVWDSQLPHGNFPNESDSFRMVQYIKMIPVADPREFKPIFAVDDEKLRSQKWFPEDYEPSPLGRKLLGLDAWEKVL